MIARVRLTSIDVVPGCTVAKGAGIDTDGAGVLLQADWRAALPLADALEAGDAVEAYLDAGHVIAWRRA